MSNMFYIVEVGDSIGFPLIGTENLDSNGGKLMSDEMFKLFASDVLGLVVRSCANRTFDIVWEDVSDVLDVENWNEDWNESQ